MNRSIAEVVEAYFERIRTTRALGAGTPETSYYDAVKGLFDAIGATVTPHVHCLSQLANTGAGSPDFGLYSGNQLQRGEPRAGQPPSRGVVEMKGVEDDTLFKTNPAQISKYFDKYRLVIITNLRSFQIIGDGPDGNPVRMESFTLAPDAKSFWKLVQTPTASAKVFAEAFGEYVRRAVTQTVALHNPKDVAWFLASYARDALARVNGVGELPALGTVRSSLEDALGISFEGEIGNHFFRSTLVQTLFYGLFSAWVLWARQNSATTAKFDWKSAQWYLNVPFVRTLFEQLASPSQLQPLGLTEVLDWTGDTLNRINPTVFLAKFDEGEAVQFFYEPFLAAFDPELRKQFGVWYTPNEIVRYMVSRVDRTLKMELGIADGLAADNVFVLDPCCGTGGFLKAVLEQIALNLANHGLGDTLADKLREAAQNRVFGFEIMPAPFVVAHLQVGLTLRGLGAPLPAGGRSAIYLTNALAGWESHENKPLPFPELEVERASADAIKQSKPILVILGNPPYNGFAGIASGEEERALSTEYRSVKRVEAPQGRGLNEIYTRFFRMAERKIAEKTGSGIVCFISNYSWLDGLSYTGMRERFLEVFSSIRIDNLHGDRKASERAPDGRPSATVFAVRGHSPGIKVGTAIATLVRTENHVAQGNILYRDFDEADADLRRASLQASIHAANNDAKYDILTPSLPLKLTFKKGEVAPGYVGWPKLPELLPISFPGIQTSRDEFLVSIDEEILRERISKYFDSAISDEEIGRIYPVLMNKTKRFSPIEVRTKLKSIGADGGKFIRYAYRPFDVRWLYWEKETKLLDEKREDYEPHVIAGNQAIVAQQKPRGEWPSSQVIQDIACLDLIDRGSSNFPRRIVDSVTGEVVPNTSASILSWLGSKSVTVDEFFAHIVATLHAPSYAKENAGALRIDWPRIPIPNDSEILRNSAVLGEKMCGLLDVETEVAGISAGALHAGVGSLAIPRGSDYEIRAGWGSAQTGRTGGTIIMPGNGKAVIREWSENELLALAEVGQRHDLTRIRTTDLIGSNAVDVYLNDDFYWMAVPLKVWTYASGGYPVLKKWLSYREAEVLGRPLNAIEIRYFASLVRRLTEVLLYGPALDASLKLTESCAIGWEDGRPASQS